MIELLSPNIFDKDKIISGVSKRNVESFPPYGFTVSNAEIANDEEVQQNRMILASELGFDYRQMAFQKQIHGDKIRYISQGADNALESDGMMTDCKGMIISISIADCAAVLIYDPVIECICGVHSGWMGTKLNICKKAVRMMNEKFKSNPSDLIVYVSPCAGGDRYEVGKDVADFFPRSIKELPSGKFLFDNKNEIRLQLLDSGIQEQNIEISEICTISDENYHSYRRDGIKSGRMSAFIGMRI